MKCDPEGRFLLGSHGQALGQFKAFNCFAAKYAAVHS